MSTAQDGKSTSDSNIELPKIVLNECSASMASKPNYE
ncbi:hypothetical protein M2368_002606 [Arthrobacter sp. JUb119]|nr:hypothetical protein [Arthrobacter sp. JUb119]TDU18234.1 hypothetical protein EDF61_11726 [Arthrobacter sp. JUb115]